MIALSFVAGSCSANMKLLAALTVLHVVSLCSADLDDEYDHFAALDELENFKLFWSVDTEKNEVSFAVEVRTTGWVGFGISSGNGKMKGSDLVIGWVKDCKGYLTDRYADGYSVPVLDKHQDYNLTGFSEKDGTTILKFKRKIDTCDALDRKIMGGTSKVVFAYHTEDPKGNMDLQKHTERGARELMLLNSFKRSKGSSSGENLQYFDVLNNKAHVPPNDTTYWCHPVKLPTFDKKYHVVKYAPIIQEGHAGLVHHIIVYQCDSNFNESLLDKGNVCRHPNMPPQIRWCRRNAMLAAWAIGQKEFLYPVHTGLPVGTDDSPKVVVMETHFDNPNEKSDWVDSSGLRFYYTEPRKYDAGIIMTGWAVNDAMMIPPKQQGWATSGYCAKECTEAALSGTEGMNIFASVLHTHLAGRKIKVRHIRDGKELPELVKDDNYDFNFQEAQHLPKEIKVLPGDELLTECVYNTMDRTERTKGGESTREEMCLSFLMYYPRVNLTDCLSIDHGYYYWLANYGFTNFTHVFKQFPVQWNQTMTNDLKAMYAFAPNMSVICRGIPQRLPSYNYPKPKILSPLPPLNDSCTASGKNGTYMMMQHNCDVSGARDLGASLISSVLFVVVAMLTKYLAF